MSMCSASHPSSRAIAEAMRSARHFLPSSAFPPYPDPYDQISRVSGKCTMYFRRKEGCYHEPVVALGRKIRSAANDLCEVVACFEADLWLHFLQVFLRDT